MQRHVDSEEMQSMKIESDAIYYALIIVFVGATLFLVSPYLFKAPNPTNVITTPDQLVPVHLVVLSSSKCKVLCETSTVESNIANNVAYLNVTRLDVETPQGRRFAINHNLTLVPAYVFSSTLSQRPEFSNSIINFSQYVRKVNDSYVLGTLETQSGYMFNNVPSLSSDWKLFVTSYNPASLRFQNASLNVLRKFNESINFSLHFVVSNVNGSLSSIVGPVELIEDSIQLCALQSGSKNALNAINCRSEAILGCYNSSQEVSFCAQFWKPCMQGWGLNDSTITSCVQSQNQTLLANEAQVAIDNRIIGVPTTIIGNQYKLFGGRSESDLLSAICGVYPSLAGCTISVRQ